jgi:hypothetical protein
MLPFPTLLRSPPSNLRPLLRSHSSGARCAAFAAERSRCRILALLLWRRFPVLDLARRNINDAFGELGGVAGAFRLLGHARYYRQPPADSKPGSRRQNFKLTHYHTVICLDDHRRKRLGPSHLRVVKCDFLKPATQAETAQKPGQADEAIDRARRAMYANAGVTLIGARMTAARWQGGDWE